MMMGDLLVPHRRCTSDARWVAGRGSDDRTGTGIRAPSAGPVDMHVWAVDGSRGASHLYVRALRSWHRMLILQ